MNLENLKNIINLQKNNATSSDQIAEMALWMIQDNLLSSPLFMELDPSEQEYIRKELAAGEWNSLIMDLVVSPNQ